jgi:putative flippase GtrA
MRRRSPLSAYRRLPEKARMVLTALAGVAIGFVTYEIVYALVPFEPRATTSWFLAFVIGIVRQHALHRWLTFRPHPPYWPSLGRAFVLDLAVLLISTALNWALTEQWGVDHRVAWLACLLTSAVLGLALLKRFVFALPRRPGRPGPTMTP